jgi:hypothetical protein
MPRGQMPCLSVHGSHTPCTLWIVATMHSTCMVCSSIFLFYMYVTEIFTRTCKYFSIKLCCHIKHCLLCHLKCEYFHMFHMVAYGMVPWCGAIWYMYFLGNMCKGRAFNFVVTYMYAYLPVQVNIYVTLDKRNREQTKYFGCHNSGSVWTTCFGQHSWVVAYMYLLTRYLDSFHITYTSSLGRVVVPFGDG